ncbi:MAG: Collagenase [Myxococcales bacterium]|nr:Collagenase [Myxococcales bacterium]
MRTFAILLAAAVQFGDLDAHDGWATQATRDGVTLEWRAVAGSKFHEYRSFVDVAIDPARAVTEIWAALRGGDMDSLKHRDLLRDTPDELVIYDQIRTPIVSDRDYTITMRRISNGARTEFRCETTNEKGPPPARGYVRIPRISAGWQVEPNGKGGTRLGYFAFSEPGGSVPAFLVRGAQADRSLADVVRMKQRLERIAAQRR